jgi:organic radical activating enzyme
VDSGDHDHDRVEASVESDGGVQAPLVARSQRTVAFVINDRCPLRCKHCAVGYWEENSGSSAVIKESDLRQSILAVDRSLYDTIIFVGGEPTLEPRLLRVGTEACQEAGFLSAITTAPVWARTPELAQRFLKKLPHLDIVTLSYDEYHLEFLTVDHYTNAANAAIEQEMQPAFNLCHSNDEEKILLLNKIHHLLHQVEIHCQKVLAVGNATRPDNVALSGIRINSSEDLARIERSCDIGNAVVDTGLNLHGCCWASSVPESPFRFASDSQNLSDSLMLMEQDPTFQKVRKHGLIDSLTEQDKRTIARSMKNEVFINECDLCLSLMTKKNRPLWEECIAPRQNVS